MDRESCPQPHHASHIFYIGVGDTAEDHIIHLRRIDLGAGDGFFHHQCAQFLSAEIGQLPAVFTQRRAHRCYDDNIFHKSAPHLPRPKISRASAAVATSRPANTVNSAARSTSLALVVSSPGAQ